MERRKEQEPFFGFFVSMEEISGNNFELQEQNKTEKENLKFITSGQSKSKKRGLNKRTVSNYDFKQQSVIEEKEEVYNFEELFANQPLDHLAKLDFELRSKGKGYVKFMEEKTREVGDLCSQCIEKISVSAQEVVEKVLPKSARLPIILTVINFVLKESRETTPFLTRYGC